MSYEIDLKPTFLSQLLALPQREVARVMEKVRLLQDAPQPDAKNKKRLQGYKSAVYRIRAGDYRILYTFGEGWVALLGVDIRRDVYAGAELVAEAPSFDIAAVPGEDELLAPADVPAPPVAPKPSTQQAHEEALPVKLDSDLLGRLRVPDQFVAPLCACRTFDDLLEADVPEAVRTRVFDVITSPDYDQVIAQPSFVATDVDDLLRFHEGELLGFLLKLDPEQERFVTWAIGGAGPTLVKGGPGTGKSMIALYRAMAMIRALREAGVPHPRLLFTTYTNALVASSRQLLMRLLGPDAALVDVRTADSLATEIVAGTDGLAHPIDGKGLRDALTEALETARFDGAPLQRRSQARTIATLTPEYLLQEIGGVIQARELTTLDAYLAAARPGRRVPLNAAQRTAVWRVHEALERALARRGQVTWEQMRQRAVEIVRAGRWPSRYDGVIIDEAQDLDPTVLRMLVHICRSADRLFVTADANQSIYGSGFRWTDVHADLKFRGRTGVLHHNYRSTREIGEAAYSYLHSAALDGENEVAVSYRQSGPLPAIRTVTSREREVRLLHRFLSAAVREFRLGVGSCAVLVPTEAAGRAIATALSDGGLEAAFMTGRELDLERRTVKIITLKSAKGLEFPIVAIAGFSGGFVPGLAGAGAPPEESEEGLLRERRTMYVAMTRAMRALCVITPDGGNTTLFSGFEPSMWNMSV